MIPSQGGWNSEFTMEGPHSRVLLGKGHSGWAMDMIGGLYMIGVLVCLWASPANSCVNCNVLHALQRRVSKWEGWEEKVWQPSTVYWDMEGEGFTDCFTSTFVYCGFLSWGVPWKSHQMISLHVVEKERESSRRQFRAKVNICPSVPIPLWYLISVLNSFLGFLDNQGGWFDERLC